VEPPLLAYAELRLAHPSRYLVKLGYSFFLSNMLEVPTHILPSFLLRWRVLEPMLYQCKGTIG
jgi:hypothetical protein